MKKGSDTCIISNDEISTGDILYIAVRCINPCDYSIASDYFTLQTIPLNQVGVRTQYQFDGHSSHVYEFYIPQDASDGFTRAISFTVESEDEYRPIDMYFSLDDSIYQIDERKMENLIQ